MSDLHIDGGHGDDDSGAYANGQMEKEWTLEASLYQQERFEELGVDVSMTRTTDVNFESVERTNIVKASGAEICLSNHFNAGGGYGAETIHSIYSDAKLATMIADAFEEAGQSVRRVFSREGNDGDYYYMHRMTGSVETIIVEYGFLDSDEDFAQLNKKEFRIKLYEAVIKAVCAYIGVKYVAPSGSVEEAPKPSQPKHEDIVTIVEVIQTSGFSSYRLESKVDGLRFYDSPSWEDTDFVGKANEGIGFPTIVKKLKVDNGYQYEVENSNGSKFYITASEKFVRLEKKDKPDFFGKRVESIHDGELRFYNKPSWEDKDVAGRISKGYGFPKAIKKINVDDSFQYEVENSKGLTFYITANKRFVKVE